jgi:hypothetical protein
MIDWWPGLPDFSWCNIPKWENIPNYHKTYEMSIKYTKWAWNIPNGHKIYKHLAMQDPQKFTQICIFGMKIYHLATLLVALSVERSRTNKSGLLIRTACQKVSTALSDP